MHPIQTNRAHGRTYLPVIILLLCLGLLGTFPRDAYARTEAASTDGDATALANSSRSVPSNMHSTEFEDILITGVPQEEQIDEAAAEEEIIVHSGMSLRSSQAVLDYFSVYSDSPFRKPATTYNHKLARMSICMATCANRPIPYSSNITLKPDQYLVQYLQDCGFTNLREDDYDKTPSLYTVATAMGSKKITDENGEEFTLIAVGVCGGNYKKEWLSNVTLGLGARHRGFDSAARMVTDRIFGYMGSNHISGRVKIWIAGFSRAAAVSNVTAANLVDSQAFAKEDIYAYTFATPRTTKDYGPEGYENIFNIVGPMDMVPQVAPAAWGFGRYGNDLVLPGKETDSHFAEKYALVQKGFKEMYGSVTNYNPKLNFCLRLLIGLTEQIVTCQEEYDTEAQENILSILEDKSPKNVLRVLRRLMVNTKDDPEDKKVLEDQLVEFMGRIATGIILGDDLEENANMGTTGSRLFHEHIEDLYLMWLNAGLTPEQLFDHPNTFTYLMVMGRPSLVVEDASTGEELYAVSGEGEVTQLEAAKQRNLSLAIEIFPNGRIEETLFLLALPHDADYRVRWTIEHTEYPVFAWAMPSTIAIKPLLPTYNRAQLSDSASASDLHIGDTGIAYEAYGDQIVTEESMYQEVPTSILTWLMGVDHVEGGWRATIMRNILLVCLLLILFRAIVATINRWGSDEHWQFRFIFSSLVMIGLVESEASYWLFAANPIIRFAWKALAGAAVLGYCICCRQKGSKWFWGIFWSMVLCTAGDLAINFWFLPGVALFAFAHVFLIWLFQRIRPLPKPLWFWWAILSLATAVAAYQLAPTTNQMLRFGVAAYPPILILMLMTGQQQAGNLRLGSFIFFVSDSLLGLYFANGQDPYVHMAYMALYYLALLIMCRSLIDEQVFIAKDGRLSITARLKKLLGLKDGGISSGIEELAGAVSDTITD